MHGPAVSVFTRGVPADFVPTAAFHGKNRTIELKMQLEASFTILNIYTYTHSQQHTDTTT